MTAEELEQKLLDGLDSGAGERAKDAFGRYWNGDISLGKLAESVGMEKSKLRELLDGYPVIDYSLAEMAADVSFLLNERRDTPNA